MSDAGGPSRRRLLASVGGAAAAALSGCQVFESADSEETVTPAAVPDPARSGGRLLVRHEGAQNEGPAEAAMTDLLEAFAARNEGLRVGTAPPDAPRPATPNAATVDLGHVGGALAPRAEAGDLAILERTWERIRQHIPVGLSVACYLDRDLVAIPQSVHRLNCLYYNPATLDRAGVDIETYTTFRDLHEEPAGLGEAVDTLFAQPLASPRDRLALWESLLGGRLVSQAQFDQMVTGGVPPHSVPVRRATGDYAAALSMTPDAARVAPPEVLLDGVVDGEIGFVRQPSWVAHHLVGRADATYGENWAVAPVFSSPWVFTFVADGFAVPGASGDLSTARAFVRFAIETERQRHYNERRGAIPARQDIAGSVDHHPFYAAQAEDYQRATIFARSLADQMAVTESVRRQLFEALAGFERHESVERTTGELVAALETASML